jgi:hypothetical protein
MFDNPPIYPLLLLDQTNDFMKERALSIISDSLQKSKPQVVLNIGGVGASAMGSTHVTAPIPVLIPHSKAQYVRSMIRFRLLPCSFPVAVQRPCFQFSLLHISCLSLHTLKGPK